MSKKVQVTGWISEKTPPIRKGWYQRDYLDVFVSAAPDYWDGMQWWLGGGSPKQATPPNLMGSNDRPWRGLASDPKAKP